MTDHGKRGYHLISMTKMTVSECITRYQQPSAAIDIHKQVVAKRRLEDNQRVIESLFKVILLCGMQGLGLCGHRNDHIKWDNKKDVSGNQGNFVALVHYRAETDETLKKHLQNAPQTAKYTSKTIQNHLIDIIGKCIILDEVREAKFYSIIADEVCDVSNKEQLSLCLGYIQASSVKERFLDFVQVERIIGRELATSLPESLGFATV